MLPKKDDNVMLTLDIGCKNIKIAQIINERDEKVLIKNYGIAPTPKGTFKDGVINGVEKIALAIRETIRKHEIKGSRVSAIISSEHIDSKLMIVEIDPKENEDLEIKKTLDKYLTTVKTQTHEIDYRVVGREEISGKKKLKILITAILKDIVQSYIDVLLRLDLVPVLIDVPAYSLERFFKRDIKIKDSTLYQEYGKSELKDTFAVIDFGSKATSVNIFNNRSLEFNNTILSGGSDVDEMISQALYRSDTEAEVLKQQYGKKLPEVFSQQDKKPYEEAMHMFLTKIIQEVKGGFKFYIDKSDGVKISHVYVIGGGSELLGLREFLSDELKMPVLPIGMLDIENVKFDENLNPEKINYLINCVGLAMG